jgi:hypothetical protein
MMNSPSVDTFLKLAFSAPTVVFTTALLVMLAYWVLVLVGAFGFDLHADAAIDAKGAAIDAKLNALETKSGLMEMLGFGVVPATVSITLLVFWAWVSSLLGSALFGSKLGGWMPVWTSTGVIALLACTLAFALAAASVRPLQPLFAIRIAPTRHQLLGKVATVSSLRVDATFGQATLEDGGSGLILSVFCAKQNTLKKGDRVLLLDFSERAQSYEIEPVDWLLPEELTQLSNPLGAEAVARALVRQRRE